MQPLEILTIPLDGVNLIEASAGTGKTYTISNLYLRLILEKEISVRDILVVTFTDAATKELKERIRNILSDTLHNLMYPDVAKPSDNEIICDLVNKSKDDTTRNRYMTHLKKAVICFDEASIFTIHGFCKRMLSENAFESSLMFDMELIQDQSRLIMEISDDFWRKTFGDNDLLTVAVMKKNGLDPSGLLHFSRMVTGKPMLLLLPEDVASSHEELINGYHSLHEEWKQSSQEIKDILYLDKGLGRSAKAYKKESLDGYFKNLEFCFDIHPHENALKDLSMFSSEIIDRNMKKNKESPTHPFFDLCREYADIEKKYIIWIKKEFTGYLESELEKRKKASGVQSFDDLLVTLYTSLKSKNGLKLANSIRKTYQVALIDEFQDTDPVQYEIFKTIFFHDNCSLFMIGDPKQSIYGFRGADIFSYLEVASQIPGDRKFTLDRNWRSET